MILLIDNYDSFVHNLARYVRELGFVAEVVRNDQATLDDIAARLPQAIILSPGPCTPTEAGISVPLVQRFQGVVPILGVCLGHQAIGAALGGRVVRAPEPVHGRASWIRHDETALFAGVANPFAAARYHSLILDEATLPATLQVTARTLDGIPMAIEDADRRLYGLQFHPESVLTRSGHRLLRNFLALAGLASEAEVTMETGPASAVVPISLGLAVTPVAWPAPLTDVVES